MGEKPGDPEPVVKSLEWVFPSCQQSEKTGREVSGRVDSRASIQTKARGGGME